MSEELSGDDKRFIQEWIKYNYNDKRGKGMTIGFLMGLLERFYISTKRKQISETEARKEE